MPTYPPLPWAGYDHDEQILLYLLLNESSHSYTKQCTQNMLGRRDGGWQPLI
jgi:hypothetical protein